MRLTPQHMEVLRRGRCLHDREVVLGGQEQEALDAAGAVLGTLALVAVGQQHDQAGVLVPLVLGGHQELVDDDLGAVHEVAELGLPDHERRRVASPSSRTRSPSAAYSDSSES